MTLARSSLSRASIAVLLAGACGLVAASEGVAELAGLYRTQVDARLQVPADETRRYARLAEEALVRAGVVLARPQYVAVVDRDPWVQAFLLLWRAAPGEYQLVGASPVSTGRTGGFDNFETPLGVFEHSPANPDGRAPGTPNSQGLRGYGVEGMRIFDFGRQRVPRGWGDGAVTEMHLRMHATDPDLLERRLGTAQSKGGIRIPATLNRLLDQQGVLDAAYDGTAPDDRSMRPQPQRRQLTGAGRYLLVVESGRSDRPDWSPAPYIPHRRPPAPPATRP